MLLGTLPVNFGTATLYGKLVVRISNPRRTALTSAHLDDMDKLVSLCKRRGFVFQSSEIYGGLGSTWDYGPLGIELKNNIKAAWWRSNVWERDDMVGQDAAILMHPRPGWPAVTWRASPTHSAPVSPVAVTTVPTRCGMQFGRVLGGNRSCAPCRAKKPALI